MSFINEILNNALKILIVAMLFRNVLIETSAFIRTNFIGPEYTHYDIYVPSNFDERDIRSMEYAANEWEEKTHHIVVFKFFNHIDNSTITDRTHSVFIMKANANNGVIKNMDKQLSELEPRLTLGLYNPNYRIPVIILVPDRIDDDESYQAVIMHEFGHAFGLGHNVQKETLMYETINDGSSHITKNDLIEFCRLYYCNANKL
jgi:hypothetical protein